MTPLFLGIGVDGRIQNFGQNIENNSNAPLLVCGCCICIRYQLSSISPRSHKAVAYPCEMQGRASADCRLTVTVRWCRSHDDYWGGGSFSTNQKLWVDGTVRMAPKVCTAASNEGFISGDMFLYKCVQESGGLQMYPTGGKKVTSNFATMTADAWRVDGHRL